MRLRNRGGIFQVDFIGPDGKRRRVSTQKSDRMEAEVKAAAIIARAHREGTAGAALGAAAGDPRMTVEQLLDYCTRTIWKGQRSAGGRKYLVGALNASIGGVRLPEVTYATLSGHVAGMRARGCAPASCNRHMAVMSRALREAEAMGWLPRSPKIPRLREDNVRERYLSRDEEDRLLAAIQRRCSGDRPEYQYLYALVQFMLDTGCRLSEAMNLTFDEVKSGAVILKHGTTKSGKGRQVPMTARAKAAVLIMLTSDVHGKIKQSSIWTRFQRACDDSAVPGVSLHTLRHTFASRLIQKGLPLYTVQRLLGHSSPLTTTRYSHLAPESLQEAADALEAFSRVTQDEPAAQDSGTSGTPHSQAIDRLEVAAGS